MKPTRILALIALAALSLPAFAGEEKKESEAWTILFDGKSLDQWTHSNGNPVTKGWKVEDGVIHRLGGGGSIISKEKFENFVLEFEFKISKKGNSGVKYRFQKGLGLEYQVLDDGGHRDSGKPNHRVGSLYDLLAAPDSKPVKPAGEWNTGRIVANGTHLEHWLNGEKVIEIDQTSDDWKTRFAESKYRKSKGFGTGAGHIQLQDHGNPVWFRNIRIKKLP